MQASIPFSLAIAVCVGAAPSWANWGSDAGGSVATGDFHSFGTERVEMVRENLVIRLYRDRAKVEIDYIMRNTGAAVDVRAGFPSLGVQDPELRHREIEDYAISADGIPVAYTREKGDPAPFKALYDAKFIGMISTTDVEPGTEDQNLLLEWLVSTVHFATGQARHIHISYESLYAYCTGGYSDDSDDCDDRFAYVLSTAAAWKGPILHGRITIIPASVNGQTISISPAGRFQHSGRNFVWEFDRLRPTPADDIVVSMNNRSSTIAAYGDQTDGNPTNFYTVESGKYFLMSRDFAPSGESAGADYGPEKIRDVDPNTEWRAAHSPGTGERLTLRPMRPARYDQVGVIPGCGKDKTAWFSHTRIRQVEVVVNGQYSTTRVLPDEYISFWPGSDKAYQWLDLPSYPGDAHDIRLTIRSVYPGLADQVTCVSKVWLRHWLPGRPAITSGIDGHALP